MTRVVLLLSTFSSIRQNADGAFFGGSFLGHCRNHHRPYRKAADAGTSVFSSPTRDSAPEMAVPPHQHASRSDGNNNDNDDELMDDITLLETITRTQLVELCESCQLPVAESASKQVLLQQLRQHAAMQAAAAQERLERRRRRVEEGAGWGEDDDFSSKERYELVEDNYNYDNKSDKDLWDDDEAVFLYAAPDVKTNSESSDQQSKRQKSTGTSQTTKQKQPTRILDRSTVTAPPLPPDTPVNEDGTRSVTIYSTTEQNDLTAVASSQPGANQQFDPLSSSGVNTPQPWDLERQMTSSTSERALEQARVQILELVSNLLTLSGAPGFLTGMDDDDDDDDGNAITTPVYSSKSRQPFVGFNPATVPTDWLNQASAALKAGRGQILQEVLREFELRAVGLDGAMGDARDRGGGHYAEVNKVRAFLEGYRRAQVRKVARETATLLLDKLCSEGLDGLDITLASMVRSNDDTASEAGVELNDSLLDFLNDAIRQQEKKVDQLVAKRLERLNHGAAVENRDDESDHDPMQQLWNVTMEDGQRVETLDPRNPIVQRVLQEEAAKADAMSLSPPTGPTIPETAPEQLLLLLTLLRERVKTEAAFGTDEKGRNLRLLAYCLRVSTNEDREQLILNAVGNSLDVSRRLALGCIATMIIVSWMMAR